jgi:hypothetical protein
MSLVRYCYQVWFHFALPVVHLREPSTRSQKRTEKGRVEPDVKIPPWNHRNGEKMAKKK